MIGGYGRRRTVPRSMAVTKDATTNVRPGGSGQRPTTSSWIAGAYEPSPWRADKQDQVPQAARHQGINTADIRNTHVDAQQTFASQVAGTASISAQPPRGFGTDDERAKVYATALDGHMDQADWRCGAPISKCRWLSSSMLLDESLDENAKIDSNSGHARHLMVATASGGRGLDAVYVLRMFAGSVPPHEMLEEVETPGAVRGVSLGLTPLCRFQTRGKVTDVAEIRPGESRGGCLLAAASSKGVVEIFNVGSTRQQSQIITTLGGQAEVMKHRESIVGITLTEESGGQLVALGSAGSICIFDIETGQLVSCVDTSSRLGFLCGTGLEKNMLATGTMCGRVSLWDLRVQTSTRNTQQAVSKVALTLMHPHVNTRIRCLTADPAAYTYIMGGTLDGELVTWDRRKVAETIIRDDLQCLPVSQTTAHTGPIWDVRVAGGVSGRLVTAGEDGHALAWNYQTAAARRGSSTVFTDLDPWASSITSSDVHILSENRFSSCNSIDVAPDNNVLACAYESGTLSLLVLQ